MTHLGLCSMLNDAGNAHDLPSGDRTLPFISTALQNSILDLKSEYEQ